MKKITLIIALLISGISLGQSSELTGRTWRCTNLVIDGEFIAAPNNWEVENVILIMYNDNDPNTTDFETVVCNGLYANDAAVTYDDANSTFTLPELIQSLGSCNNGENGFFENKYFGFYYDNIGIPLSYEVIELTEEVMTITAPNGDSAHYQEGLVENQPLNLLDGSDTQWTLTSMTIDDVNLPAPTDDEITPILARFYFDVDIFAFETSVCENTLYAAPYQNDESEIGFSGIEQSNPSSCNISENVEYATTYFEFFEEDINYTYSSYESASGTLLAITHPNGDIAFYTKNTLGIINHALQQASMYPNPASTIINIDAPTISINRVEIFSITGQLLNTIEDTSAIDISSLSQGTYFLKITSGTSSVFKQFLKR